MNRDMNVPESDEDSPAEVGRMSAEEWARMARKLAEAAQ